jgi:glyoxylase-like metal-dependent hydrolase (beta-lactamase superfamily II)
MTFLPRPTALIAILAAAPAALAGQQPAMEVTVTPVAEGVWMLAGPGGNIGVSIGPDGVILIDDQVAPVVPKIREALAKLDPRAPRFVINTHWHADHTGGNEAFGEAGAIILAHDNVRVRLTTEQFLEAFNQRVPPSPAAALPVITFTEAVTLHLNGGEVHVFHVAPAHTDGDAVVHFRSANVVHAGDVLFTGMYAFLDVSSGGNVAGMLAGLDRLAALGDERTKFIPGHGPLATRADVRAARDLLRAVCGRVLALVREGRSVDAIVAAKPTRDYDAQYANPILTGDLVTRMIATDLARPGSAGCGS